MYKISLEDIQFFLTVAKTKHFTKAASLLFTTQPNVTKRIAHIEKVLDLKLIERNSKHVVLTQVGQTLYEQWNPLYKNFMRSIEDTKNAFTNEDEVIHIGALYGFGYENSVMKLIHNFKKDYPNAKLDFCIYNFYELSQTLDELDIIFTTSYESENLKDYEEILLNKIKLFVTLSRENDLASRQTLSVKEIGDKPFLIFSNKTSPTGPGHILDALNQRQVNPRLIYVANIPSMLLKLKENQGICISNQELIHGNQASLITIPLTDFDIPLYTTCICNQNICKKATLDFFQYVQKMYDFN